jgi:ABC-type xylose transport system, periplasmic component
MKKSVRIAAMALAGIMSLSLLAGCGSGASKDDGKVKIGISLPTLQEERWVRDRDTMKQAAKDAGVEALVQVANMDASKQDNQCENLISQGIDILILAPHDATAAAAIVDKAHKAGIKVISYDRLVMGTDVDVYMSFDNVKVGELQGKWFTDNVPKGNIVWLSGSPADHNATLFKEGAAKYLKPKIDSGDYRVVMEQPVVDWKPDNALKLMENALTESKNDIQGVLAPNDGTAGGCIQALAAQNLDGKVPITGQDSEVAAAKRIVEGTQGMTIFKDTRELGKAAVAAAIKMVNGEDPGANQKVNNEKTDVPSILLDPVVVDKANIDKVLIDSGYLKKEDVYGK